MLRIIVPPVRRAGVQMRLLRGRGKNAKPSSSSFLLPAVRHFSEQRKVGTAIGDDADATGGGSISSSNSIGIDTPKIKTAGAVLGGSVVLYGISTIFYDLASTFMSLTPALSLKYGFGFGMVSTAASASILWQFERAVYAKPELAFHTGMGLLQRDESVSSLLGGSVTHTSLDVKSYKSRGGSFGVIDGSMSWMAPRVELLFSGRGSHGGHVDCLVIMEQRFWGQHQVEFVGVDILSDASTKVGNTKRTRLVIKETNAAAEEAHFALFDRILSNMKDMRRD